MDSDSEYDAVSRNEEGHSGKAGHLQVITAVPATVRHWAQTRGHFLYYSRCSFLNIKLTLRVKSLTETHKEDGSAARAQATQHEATNLNP